MKNSNYTSKSMVSWDINEWIFDMIEILNTILQKLFSCLEPDIIVALAAIIGLILIYGQLRADRKSSKAEFSIQITKELRDEKWRKRLKTIYNADDELEDDETLRSEVEYTLDKFEWVGIMLNEGIFPSNMVMKLIGGLPLRVWYKLHIVGFVKKRRKERGHYAIYAEYFTKRSIEYQVEYIPMEDWTLLGGVDILSEIVLQKDLINLQKLRWINFNRKIRAIINKKLSYGRPLSLKPEDLKNRNINEIEKSLELEDPIIISNYNWISELHTNHWISKFSSNGWISELFNNKWKIAYAKKKSVYLLVESGGNIYDCKGYEKWYEKQKKWLMQEDAG